MKQAVKRAILLGLGIVMVTSVGCTNLLSAGQSSSPAVTAPASGEKIQLKTKVLFINTSRNRDGNTEKMGEAFLEGIPHDTIFLNDYRIYQLGQQFEGDQLSVVLDAMEQADIIVIGTPVYWHTMSGPLKTFIDRLYELDKPVQALKGKKLYFLMQGAAPSAETKEHTPYIMSRVASQYDMEYMGAATSMNDISELRKTLQ